VDLIQSEVAKEYMEEYIRKPSILLRKMKKKKESENNSLLQGKDLRDSADPGVWSIESVGKIFGYFDSNNFIASIR
jgi:hypothetical protein